MIMERHLLVRLLAGGDEASVAALAALRSGATYVVWDGTPPAESLAASMRADFGTRGGRASRLWDWNERCSSSASMISRCALGRSQLPMGHGSSCSSSPKTAAHWWPALAYGGRASNHRFTDFLGLLSGAG